MKPTLQFRIAQQLTLTPQLQQAIRMLQMSSLELAHEVEQALRQNPFLERTDESLDSFGSGDFQAADQLDQAVSADRERINDPSTLQPSSHGLTGEHLPVRDEPLAFDAKPLVLSGEAAQDFHALSIDQPADFTTIESFDDLGRALHADDAGQSSSSEHTPAADDPKAWEQAAWDLQGNSRNDSDDEARHRDWRSTEDLLSDHLKQQLLACHVTERDRALVQWLIDALDEDGMLRESIASIQEGLPKEAQVDEDELLAALKLLQSFDPPGVGARDTVECLSIQLRQRDAGDVQLLALRLVNEQLETLAKHDFIRLRRQLGCSEIALQQAHRLVLSLNPRPAAGFRGAEPLPFVVPDVDVRQVGKRWQAFLIRGAMPEIQLNEHYVRLLRQNKSPKSEAPGLNDQVQSARWLVKNLKQRGETILRVARFIVDHQQRFFSVGEVAMRPLAMRMVAEALELHESTISRVTSQKYMLTPRGTFELKYFFTAQVGQESAGDTAQSSTAIRARVRAMIGDEAVDKPLSDARIAELLTNEGSQVARRTVAKYRESLKIAPASQRRKRRI
ncbi:MAG: RNA polymerase sigma-54 factor [Betaproteobacteria bacterium]|nr:RNA polymerase factor sigma-54 [Pseudomonadota bacterium]NBO02867.1 RNA polymerase sigma-54 factor [Betaproteobacteria bacterium]NCW24168.1 RNA polymerase sigma-54 factor [Betaproteobacteria bacterium]NDE45010.1 RNA polymerase sigma-54 factor [Betaproteobacteria bacterium]NDE93352.1 RNA polymerase sigma-54 factor [Betaproteobacteria bacterium]